MLYNGKIDIAKRFLYSKQGKPRYFARLNANFPCFRNIALSPTITAGCNIFTLKGTAKFLLAIPSSLVLQLLQQLLLRG